MMKNNMTTFYLIRHGETDWNKNRIVQGQNDTLLNALGEKQAKESALKFKDMHFDLAFSSDLLRAKRTAEIISLEHNLAVQTTKALRERAFGSLEKKSSDKVLAHQKLLMELKNEARKTYKFAGDAESDEEIAQRVFRFLRETAVAYPDKKILVGTHGGVLRIILLHLGIASYEELENKRFVNAGYITLRSDGTEFIVDETFGFEPRQKGSSDL